MLGFSHFQGDFFARPRGEGGTPQGALASLAALGELTSAGASFEDIERIIGADVGLSIGLLRYVNSAYFSLPRRIDTVREALTLLGTRAVRRWATVMALSSVPDAPDQLVALALLRGRMCELLGRASSDEERDRLFTVGLLSVAEALLDAPMETVLESLPLSDEIKGALLRYEGKRGRVLATVMRYEQGHFPEGGDADPVELAEAYLTALKWADEAGRWIAEYKQTHAPRPHPAARAAQPGLHRRHGRPAGRGGHRAQPAGGAQPGLDDRRRAVRPGG